MTFVNRLTLKNKINYLSLDSIVLSFKYLILHNILSCCSSVHLYIDKWIHWCKRIGNWSLLSKPFYWLNYKYQALWSVSFPQVQGWSNILISPNLMITHHAMLAASNIRNKSRVQFSRGGHYEWSLLRIFCQLLLLLGPQWMYYELSSKKTRDMRNQLSLPSA